jgi:DNA-directed RNA polymerase subunit RPC12/RpoP
MPARIPPATVKRIDALRAEGKRACQIAAELGIHRQTAAAYCAQADRAIDVRATPAARLTEEAVTDLVDLAQQLRQDPCMCGERILSLAGQLLAVCPKCRKLHDYSEGQQILSLLQSRTAANQRPATPPVAARQQTWPITCERCTQVAHVTQGTADVHCKGCGGWIRLRWS